VLIAVLSAPLVRRLAGVRRTRSIAGAAGLWVLWCGMLAVVGVTGGTTTATVVLVVATLLFTVAEAVHAPISTAAAASAAPAAARGRYLATFQYSFAAASVIAPAFFAGLYDISHALPFLVLGLVNALSVPALLRLEEPLTARSRTH
jgi:MFS family permease